MSNEAFFHRNPKLFGLGRQFGQINFGAFWVFLAYLLAPIFCTANLLSMFSITYNQPLFLQKNYDFISKSQISIQDWDLNLNLGHQELGM